LLVNRYLLVYYDENTHALFHILNFVVVADSRGGKCWRLLACCQSGWREAGRRTHIAILSMCKLIIGAVIYYETSRFICQLSFFRCEGCCGIGSCSKFTTQSGEFASNTYFLRCVIPNIAFSFASLSFASSPSFLFCLNSNRISSRTLLRFIDGYAAANLKICLYICNTGG
jgi:hypothetical protein